MIDKRSLMLGAGAAIAGRAVAARLILLKLRRDVRRLNEGDYRGLLSGYAEDAVLRFRALTLAARFDDRATGADGEPLYAIRVMMMVRTRWGRIAEQEDFYLDTGRIDAFEEKLRMLGIEPVAA